MSTTDDDLSWALSLGVDGTSEDEPDDTGLASADKPSLASRLLKLAQGSGAKVFQDSDSGEYHVAPNGDGTQVWRLDGRDAARWLTRLWLNAENNPAAPESIKTALFNLGALVDDSDSVPPARPGCLAGCQPFVRFWEGRCPHRP